MSTREITKQLNVIVIMEIVAESITISIITCIGIRYIHIHMGIIQWCFSQY